MSDPRDDAPFLCVIDDKADLDALRGVLACALTRAPEIGRTDSGPHVSIVEMTWVRVDSPKREASLRISSFENQRVGPGSAEDMRRLAVRILERALSEDPAHDVSQTDLDGWHADQTAVGAYAALRQHAADSRVSRVDLCHATAGTAWADPCGDRPGESTNKEIIDTIDRARIERLLPDLPRIVLVRQGKINRAGRSHVLLGALHGSTEFMDLDLVERMRLDARFAHLEP